MENIVYIKIGNESKIVERDEAFCKILCLYVKNPMEQANWWERYKYMKELKKVINPFILFLRSNQTKEVIFDSAFLEQIKKQGKFSKLFSFLEEFYDPKSIYEGSLGLFILGGYAEKRWSNLETLIVELPQEELISSELERGLEEWIHLLSPTLNYLTIISSNAEQYEELEQQLYEETGLMLQTVQDKKQLELWSKNKKQRKGSKALWIDLGTTKINYRAVPRNCIYFDANNQKDKLRTLNIKRSDVSYVSVMKFLDTYVERIV